MAFEDNANLSDEQIVSEFNDLFGIGGEDDSNEDSTDDNGTDDTSEDEPSTSDDDTPDDDNTSTEDSTEDKDDSTQKEDSGDADDKQKSKQNYAFAEMRNKLKAQEALLANLGKAIGMDEKSKPEDVAASVQKILLTKQSKDTGVPVEVLERLQVLEQRDAEYTQQQLQTKTQSALADLIEKYGLSKEDSDTFVGQLIENGRNPMENPNVDLETEYIKYNFESLLKNAADSAVEKERERNKKATGQSSTKGSESPDDGNSEGKIDSVKELDKFFKDLNL